MGQRIVFTNGCYDLLHVGHISLLERARQQGDRLIVAINGDDSVRSLKGPNRPMVGEHERARVLSGTFGVDAVVIFDESTPLELIRRHSVRTFSSRAATIPRTQWLALRKSDPGEDESAWFRSSRVSARPSCSSRRLLQVSKNAKTKSDRVTPETRQCGGSAGMSGCIYPPSLLNKLKLAGPEFLQLCPRAGDVWLHVTSMQYGPASRSVRFAIDL